jgi:outer membrane protein assembly factor BamB
MQSKSHLFVPAGITAWALFAGLLAGCAGGSAVSPPALRSNSFAAPAPTFAAPSARDHAKIVNWPQAGFDSGHSGYNPKETTLSPSNVAGLTELWSTNTGNGNTTYGLISAGGVLYGMSYTELYALNPSTGVPIWTATAYAGNGSTVPAVAGNLVLADCGTSAGNQLCAFTRKNGSQVWSAPGCQCNIFTSPTVYKKLAYAEFGYGGTTWDALQAQSGDVRWDYAVGNHCVAGNSNNADPVANGSAYYTVGCQGTDGQTSLCQFNAQNGGPGWCTPLSIAGCSVASTLGVTEASDTLFANLQAYGSCVEQLVAFDAKTGVQEWAVDMTGNNSLHSQPAVAKGVVYEYDDSGVQAFSAKKGTLLWTQSSADSYSGVDVSVANGVVYAGCYHDDGELCALDAKNGNVLWSSGIGGGGYTTPIVLNGVLYGSCGQSDFCAFGLPQDRRHR